MLDLICKYVHIIAVISWMAGILYIYRLFVYHAENIESKRLINEKRLVHEQFCLMEMRLYKYITFPAMLVAFVFAIFMIWLNQALLSYNWFVFKLLAAAGLMASTFYAGYLVKIFRLEMPNPRSKILRFLNEVPTIAMLIIIAMVVFRP
ncbi:MAG: CopD family protein [Oligoflexales bacterium]|nr:CopD family protein [Oligoflexales bacterium]